MKGMKARVTRLVLPPKRRILVISDIHANIPYFEGLLKKTGFSERDELIIDGDFLEKGENSLGILRRLMDMSPGREHPCGLRQLRRLGGHLLFLLE